MRRALPAFAALLLLSAVAAATVVLRTDVEDLADLCHTSVLGKVVSSAVQTEEDGGRIWTTWRVRVAETWIDETRLDAAAGADASGVDEVVVSVPGGEADGVTQEMEGAPRLTVGERAVLFLWKRPDGRLLVVGQAQGVFHVRRDADGSDVCENDVAGLALVDRAGKRAEAAPLKLSVADLRTRVAARLAVRKARAKAQREAYERKLAEGRARALRSAELSRGKPGGAPAD